MAAVRFLNRFLKPRDSVIFFHAVPYPDLPEKYDKVARNYLDVAEKQLSVQDVKVDKRVQRSEQDVREDIFEQAKFLGSDYIVTGSQGLSGVERSVLGSVSDYITRHSELPVLVVRSETEKKEESTSTTYLVALDGSENSLQGLDLVASFFKESDKLCVAHITKYDFKDSDTQQKAVDKLKEEISKRVSLDLHLLFHLMHSQLPCMRL